MKKPVNRNPRHDLGHIPLADLARAEKQRGHLTESSLTCFYEALQDQQLGIGSPYVAERFKAFVHQHEQGEISRNQLYRHIEVLMQYAEALQSNKLQHGSLSQLWTPATQGWHPVLNRMVTLGCSTETPVQGLDPYSLSLLRDPSDMVKALLGFTCFHRKVTFLPGPEGFDSIPCTQPGAVIKLGRHLPYKEDGEIVFTYRVEHASTRFAITLTPLFAKQGFTGSYRLSASWHTGSTRPKAAIGIEELIAKSLPFGELDIILPLLTPAKEEQQTLLA